MPRVSYIVLLLPLLQLGLIKVNAFCSYPASFISIAKTRTSPQSTFYLKMVEGGGEGGGFASPAVAERPIEQKNHDDPITNNSYPGEASTYIIDDVKRSLIKNIPHITAITTTDDDYVDDDYYNYSNYNEICRLVESNINHLESIYSPVQTIDFLNLVLVGEWKLLFSTNLLLPPPHLRRSLTMTVIDGDETKRLRLVNVMQKIEAVGYNGSLTNMVQWNYEEDAPSSSKGSNSNGSFSIPCTYTIHQGSRMNLQVSDDRQLRPARIGSKTIIPDNIQELVAYLRQSMPREIFDPSDHAMDITYMDADLRIVRYTGPNFEGVRNIFLRVPIS